MSVDSKEYIGVKAAWKEFPEDGNEFRIHIKWHFISNHVAQQLLYGKTLLLRDFTDNKLILEKQYDNLKCISDQWNQAWANLDL